MITAIRQWLTARCDVRVALALFTALLIGGLWLSVTIEQRDERADTIAAVVKQNSNLAVAYEEHIVRTLKGLDGALLFMRHEYRRLGRGMDILRYVEEGIIDGRLFSLISVVDERGNIVMSSGQTGPVNYADREFFRVHRSRRSRDTLHIGKPEPGRVSNTWQMPMSRRIVNPDGSFGGVIVLSVDPAYFARFYQKADIGTHGVVTVVGLDGIARTRRVDNALSFGIDMSGSSLLQEQAKSATGEFLSLGGFDGMRRLVSYRTLPGYPLLVAVGAAQDEVLADFTRNRNRDYWLASLVSVVIVVFAVMLVVTLSRQKRAGVDLATSEARFRAAFEQVGIGIAHSSIDRHFIAVNPKFCEMLGYTRDELVGMHASSVTHPDDRDADGHFRDQLLSGEVASLTGEKRYLRRDGRTIWVSRTVSLVRDHAGRPLYFLRAVEDITERKRLEAELRELAVTDMLTGLPNRRAFMARLEEEHARIRRFDAQQAAVLMLDLDDFKRINDTRGHPAGDTVLRHVAVLIRDEIRRVDMCGRIGGEEFAILLAGATPAAAREFAERLRGKIADASVIHDGRAIAVTASIGIAVVKAGDESADAALLRADAALYRAKENGRNRVETVAG